MGMVANQEDTFIIHRLMGSVFIVVRNSQEDKDIIVHVNVGITIMLILIGVA